ncbi:MAG TPA: acireductone synthase [Acidobacteriota bacterium]|nr:acireductone synthase [Acidobacteriota bacterium]
MKPAVILCDIEGTTTSLSFVHTVLFPISYEKMEEFIRKQWTTGFIQDEIETLRKANPQADSDEIVSMLRHWILEDRKDPALKSIQGKIWKEAYESGTIRSHVYPDVPENFRKWFAENIKVCTYSSGSVEAQKLLFRYSEAGDLTPYISEYFDTRVGTKRNSASYSNIAKNLRIDPPGVLFLSDVEEELNAAREAQMQTTQVLRENVVENKSGHPIVNTFDEIKL